jgi:hypothetical protein
MVIDDEFQPGQTHAIVGQRSERESVVGIADVHHDLRAWSLMRPDHMPLDLEIHETFIDVTLCAFGTGDR